MQVVIKNCNCIKEAIVSLEENALNIKYGSNGTGKSTICKAILYKTNDRLDLLEQLRTYGNEKDPEENQPTVEGVDLKNVMVFDESYVNSYLFEQNSFLNNSFNVFLKSKECDRLVEEINQMLAEIQGIFKTQDEIHNLQQFLPRYFNTISFSGGKIKKTGGVGEFIKGNGSGFQKHPELDEYKSYYLRDISQVSKWAKWRTEGSSQIEGDKCPFCTHQLDDLIYDKNKIIAKVFKKSALDTAQAILEYLEYGFDKGFINQKGMDNIKEYIGNSTKADDLCAELQSLAVETNYLNSKINKICVFRPMNVTREQLQQIEDSLDDMIINKDRIKTFYNTELILNLVDTIREKIDNLKQNTGKLKGLFFQHDKKINALIKDRQEDINGFFALAGFPYEFEIESQGEGKVISYLIPTGMENDSKVENLNHHLSWGEKNAFSLVMFMFEALSRKADLIVLDDPITSFDKDKKFAVIRRLFDNRRDSFRGKTVLMVTHELQPIIDYIYGDFFSAYGLVTPVNAMFLQNIEGQLKEKQIEQKDLCNSVILSKEISCDDTNNMANRIVNLRKYIELTNCQYRNLPIYEVLSNLIHGRSTPKYKDGTVIEQSVIQEGEEELQKYIACDYNEILDRINNDRLVDIINNEDTYSRIIASRLYFERNSGMLSELKKQYPATCKFVNETNHIENDYIFQLNPFEFFEIPELYLNSIGKFLKDII